MLATLFCDLILYYVFYIVSISCFAIKLIRHSFYCFGSYTSYFCSFSHVITPLSSLSLISSGVPLPISSSHCALYS